MSIVYAAYMTTRTTIEALAHITETFDQVVEATAGYRAKCLQAGFSPETSEQMALRFHALLLDQIAPHS